MADDWKHRYKNAKRKEAFQEFAHWSNDDLITHILELREVIGEMEKDLMEGENGKSKEGQPHHFTEKNYKQEWSYPTKIAFLLTLHHKPHTSEELHSLLLKKDGHYKDYSSPRNNLTVTLNRAVKSGRILKVKVPGIRHLYYALPQWVDKEGKLKEGFDEVLNQFK